VNEAGEGGAVNSQTCAVASQSYLLPVKYILLLCTLNIRNIGAILSQVRSLILSQVRSGH
jgi:hypothetical protein